MCNNSAAVGNDSDVLKANSVGYEFFTTYSISLSLLPFWYLCWLVGGLHEK
jgi:hypothetical protein